jgi:hypothetical protein
MGQNGSAPEKDDSWFVYSRRAGRITAAPAS